jgi:hypothetical protein
MSDPTKLNGQWIGKYDGDASGSIHVNIDEDESTYYGMAYLFDQDPKLPTALAYFTSPRTQGNLSCVTDRILAIDRASGGGVEWETVKDQYPKDTIFAKSADIKLSWDQNALTISWKTDTAVGGNCVLPRSKADQPSELIPLEKDWGWYKEYGLERASKRPLFRGQNTQWRLRTPFHRSGRANLERFLYRDISLLHRNLSASTKHVFRLESHEDFGAFLNLAQHHGYPTPLLDWTYSPYVAAFFAYRGITNEQAAKAPRTERVRILIFDSAAWLKSFESVTQLVHPKLHVTVFDFVAFNNDRMIPQQAASTLTSVDDIESHIRSRETDTTKYLQAVDLPMYERKQVIRELSNMGITAGSLFPGLDGACEELAERNFDF